MCGTSPIESRRLGNFFILISVLAAVIYAYHGERCFFSTEVKISLIALNAVDLVNLKSTISPFSLRTIKTFVNNDTNYVFSPSETTPILRLILKV